MFETFSRSFSLIGESFAVLRKDKELLLFPLLSFLASFVLIILLIVPFILGAMAAGNASGTFFFIFFAVAGFLFYFISSFFTAGLIAAASIRLRGGDPSFSDGIKAATKNVHKILIWSLVSVIVGWLISAIGRKGILRDLIQSILKAAWEIVTFFVVPVIVLENKGIVDSGKRSIELFKKAWGESIVGQYSIGALFAVAGLLGFFVFIAALLSGLGALLVSVIILLVFYFAALIILSSTLSGIYRAALYNYAAGKKIKFSQRFLKDAFERRKK